MHFGKSCGCHQITERSFFYKNYQFPLCARCTGIFIGELIIAPVIIFVVGFNDIYVNLAFLTIMAIDGSLQYLNILASTNIRRLITGLMAGFAMTGLFFIGIEYLLSFI